MSEMSHFWINGCNYYNFLSVGGGGIALRFTCFQALLEMIKFFNRRLLETFKVKT